MLNGRRFPLKKFYLVRASRFILACIVCFGAHAEEPEDDPNWRDAISGELRVGLIGARSDRDNDIELDQLLRLRIDPPKHEQFGFRSTVWATEDLDGRESPTSPFRTLNDADNEFVNVRLLEFYGEFRGEQDNARLRVGRQRISESTAFTRIDGALFSRQQGPWEFFAFLGAHASVYRDSREDISTGAGIAWRPTRKTRIAADIFYGNDERRRFGTEEIDSTLTSVSWRQSINQFHHVFARAVWHEEDLDEVQLTSQGIFSGDSVSYILAYRQRLSTLDERPSAFPQFFRVLGELNGYDDLLAIVTIPLGKRFDLGLEAQVHDAEDEAVFSGNRDFERYGLSLSASDIASHYGGRILFEMWDADGAESDKTVSAEISREWESGKAALGVDYVRFQDRILQFDPLDTSTFLIESTDDLYSLYTRYTYDFNDEQQIDLRVSLEDDDTVDAPYLRFTARYTLRF